MASLRDLPEPEAMSLLHNLRGDTNPEVLANALRSNVNLPHGFAPQTLEADIVRQISPASAISRLGKESLAASRDSSTDASRSLSGTATPTEAVAIWFRAPQDADFVEHLLNLYFCWVHPFYQLFSRDHFVDDMGCGGTTFCSALLVNALLAVACSYSDRASARVESNKPATAGDHFFADAKSLLDSTDRPSLTTVQALGLMSIRETSHGRDSNGYQ